MNHLPPRSLSRVAVCAGALALTLATCSACVGGSTPSTGSTSPATGSMPASPSATGAPTSGGGAATPTTTGGGTTGVATTTGSGNTGSGGGPQACETQNLSVTTANASAAAGSAYYDLVFQNIGNVPCTLYGYPGVSFGAGSPVQQVGQPAARDSQVKPLIVTLIPNAHAFAVLQIGDALNYSASICDPKQTTYLRVYAPNNNTLLYIPFKDTACTAKVVTMHVEAVQPGSGS